MDHARRNEIAYLLLVHQMMKKALPAPNDFRREMGNQAKEIGVELEELMQFFLGIFPKLIGRMVGAENVSLTTNRRSE